MSTARSARSPGIADRPAPAPSAHRLDLRVHSSSQGELYLRYALRLFGPLADRAASRADKLRHALEQAHLEYLPQSYLALTWLNTALITLGAYLLTFTFLMVTLATGVFPPVAIVAVFLIFPLLLGAGAYVSHIVYPDYLAGERRRAIDRDLPYAVNYIAAMSSAGVVPSVLLRDLARETTYGEVAREVAWIVRDIDLLGVDLLTALQRATGRTPSRRFEEFVQGAKTTILSGGDLKTYFLAKADQYMAENRRISRSFLDSLGLMAESYVTVVIAGPLFMIVMLSIMLLIGNSSASSEAFLFLLTFVMLPLAHATFAWVIKNMAVEG